MLDLRKRENIAVLIKSLLVYFLLTFVFSIHPVESGSMEPSIRASSLVVGWRLPYLVTNPEVKQSDIVVFYSDELNSFLIKRVIGTGGDRVEIKEGIVYVNDKRLEEPYLMNSQSTYAEGFGRTCFEIPEKSIFVLGDNREHSYDSRFFSEPAISEKEIYSKALFSIPIPAWLCRAICGF